MRQLPDEFREFLSILNEKEVEYLVVGGWALGVHGYIRATGDMDVWIGVQPKNLRKLIKAFTAFGVPDEIDELFFAAKGNTLRMGVPPLRIEIITEASGVDFQNCYRSRMVLEVDNIEVPFISLEDLKTNKRSSGRLKDLADLEGLEGKYD